MLEDFATIAGIETVVINAGTTPSTDVRSLEIQVMSYDPLTNQQSDALVTLVGFVGRSGTRGGG